ncbi:hypothetical protein [Nocardia alni]|uniref:hypothetical protein n=1 Tax=Nocardia alni TaxID=2815723 RepID=UPI001C231B2E|nr:hypothetical protein [Nocardia alni]
MNREEKAQVNRVRRSRSLPLTGNQHGPLIERLALPRNWTVPDLTAAMARECGHSMLWEPLPHGVPTDLCGMEFVRGHQRLVFHQPATRPLHRRVIAHAAAHVLLGHSAAIEVEPAMTAIALATGLARGTTAEMRVLLASAAFHSAEVEADVLAELMLDRSANGRDGSSSCRHGTDPSRVPHCDAHQ